MKDGLEDSYELIVRLIGVIIGKWVGTEERRGGRGEAEFAGGDGWDRAGDEWPGRDGWGWRGREAFGVRSGGLRKACVRRGGKVRNGTKLEPSKTGQSWGIQVTS